MQLCKTSNGKKQLSKKLVSFFERDRNFYIVFLLAMLVKSLPFGFQYFPFSDDFTAYGVYTLYAGNLWSDVMVHYALYGLRPLAGIFDVYVISRFWPNLSLVLLLITILRFVTIVLLDRIFAKSGLIWGRVAAVFFAFFPALTESAYWLSASARIVPAAFFCTLAAFAMLKFIYQEGRYHLWFALALLSGILAQGFYEQGIIFAFVFTFGLLILHRKALPHKALFAWPFVNLGIIATHHVIFRNVGHLAHRTAVADNLFAQIPLVADRILTTFIREQMPTIVNTFRWGFGLLVREHLFLTVLVLVFSLLLALFVVFDRRAVLESGRKTARSLLTGLVLTLCTLTIFFLLAESWVWVRNFFFVILGLAIFAEIAARAIRLTHVAITVGKGAAAFLAIAIFFSGFVLEVDSLRSVAHYDRQIMYRFIDEVEQLDEDMEVERVWLFGLQWTYAPTINPRITSQIRLDWAIDGYYLALTQTQSRDRPFWIIPVMVGQEIGVDFAQDVLFGLDADLAAHRLVFEEGVFHFQNSGQVFGRIGTDGTFLMGE